MTTYSDKAESKQIVHEGVKPLAGVAILVSVLTAIMLIGWLVMKAIA